MVNKSMLGGLKLLTFRRGIRRPSHTKWTDYRVLDVLDSGADVSEHAVAVQRYDAESVSTGSL